MLQVMWVPANRECLEGKRWNHIIPLLSERKANPKLEAIYLMEWEGDVYPCQVKEVDGLFGLVFVRFMAKSRGYWVWGAKDYSWEPINSLKKEAALSIVDSMSTQRCQYFTILST